MKYLVPCLLMLPLITSCVPDDPYYRPGVEVYPGRPNQHYHHNNGYYRPDNGYYRPAPAPQGGGYHGHPGPVQHGHVVNQRAPQPRVNPQANNVHGHNGTPPRANPGRAAPVPVVVPRKTVHGHDEQVNVHGHGEHQVNVHGHS